MYGTIARVLWVLNAVSTSFSQELIGDETKPAPAAAASGSKEMKSGSIVITPGILYASSLVGGEFEFGVSKIASFMFGVGFIGADAGVGFHVLNKEHMDLSINALADYMPALQSVLPEICFSVRGFFGQSARVGLGGRIGISIITNTIDVNGHHYTAGGPMLTYCIGVPIRVKN
jgi:hypothetical protein